MDLISELGALAWGSRLKRLSDLIMKQAVEVYQSYGIDFEPKWFPLFYLLSQKQEMGIMEIAEKLNVTHPAVIQVAKELEKKGWVTSQKSGEDGRKRILKLTQKGLDFLPQLQGIWQDIRAVNEDLLNNRTHLLLPAVEELEQVLSEKEYIKIFKEFHQAK